MEEVQTAAGAPKSKRKGKDAGLREIANVPERVKAFGKEYDVRRFTLRDVAEAVQHLGPLSYVLRWLDAFPKDASGKPILGRGDLIELATRAITMSGDSVIGMLSVITKEPEAWLDEQDPLDGLELLVVGVEKNLDFFSAKNIRRVSELFGRLGKALPGLGGTPSTTSSSADMERSPTS